MLYIKIPIHFKLTIQIMVKNDLAHSVSIINDGAYPLLVHTNKLFSLRFIFTLIATCCNTYGQFPIIIGYENTR